MSAHIRQISTIPTPAPAKEAPTVRAVRFASRKQAGKAGAWAIKKYASVFKKLAQ